MIDLDFKTIALLLGDHRNGIVGTSLEPRALSGIATNFDVESTAHEAREHGFDVVVTKDAATSTERTLHRRAFAPVLPRIARIGRSTDVRSQMA